jgi:ubiquinone/menaquinone biosynthesis C-methylase UbiE
MLRKVFDICIRCYNSAFNFFFFLPCGGEPTFRRRCVKFASLKAGDRILDVCCGTGELTTVIVRQGFTGRVIGVDTSRSALDMARASNNCTQVTLVRASGDSLPFRSSGFDRCFISFGLHHMPAEGRQKALSESHRVLAPEGTLHVIDYSLPERGFRRLAAIANVKLDRSKEARKMLRRETLVTEIEGSGFDIARRRLTCQDTVQLLEMVKK